MYNFVPKEELLVRRQKLAAIMPVNSVVLLLSNPTIYRNSDIEFAFRQDSNFWYFSGFDEPDSALILWKKEGGDLESILFVRPKNPFTETWTGKMAGLDKALEIVFADKVLEFENLLGFLDSFLQKEAIRGFYLDESKYYPELFASIADYIKQKQASIQSCFKLTSKLRIIKSEWEIEQMKMAAKVNKEAHLAVIRNIQHYPPASETNDLYEYQLSAELLRHYHWNGLDWSYPPIVASGKNATTLHYHSNNEAINPQDLILIDAGCEYNYYASDITRTFPATGRFSSSQKEIYQIVLEANRAAIDMTKKHTKETITLQNLHKLSVQIISQGLIDLGIIQGSVENAIHKELYKNYFMHGTSHWLGLDVHDQGLYRDEKNQPVVLQAGMAFTVEPGLYFDWENEDIPEQYRGIGARIEDNLVLTTDGLLDLTSDLVKTVDELEDSFGS